MSKNSEQQSNYSNIWDSYVLKSFPELKSSTPYAKKQLEPWRVLNTKDERYDWPGDEWGDRETAARLLDESLTSALNSNGRYLCELGAALHPLAPLTRRRRLVNTPPVPGDARGATLLNTTENYQSSQSVV